MRRSRTASGALEASATPTPKNRRGAFFIFIVFGDNRGSNSGRYML